MKYRSKTEIIVAMLETAASGRVNKTRIMYGALLSFNQLKGYLPLLIDEGLLEVDKTNGTFKTTPKGMHFLQICTEMDTLYFPVAAAKTSG